MQIAVRAAMSLVARMADDREPMRRWLQGIARANSITLSALAREADVVQSTITRYVNDPGYKYELSSKTIRAIEKRFGVPAPASRTFADAATAEFQIRPETTGPETAGQETTGPKTTGKTRPASPDLVMAPDDSLDLSGVRRGDLCEVDTAVTPRVGDLVQAELRAGFKNRETAIRIYDPPYLMAHSTGYELNRPILIEPGRARVIGVVTRITRQLREPRD